ncbi:protein kinase [Bacillus chungangensis]|uniref:Protein kinase n=1 Tax=Bacillus chungangensis TaxID=587633 RepID=A0ABT9WXY0_9BACI|nr:protein kinase [Bacillus chungangensis]MDQ0177737.1 hypothetical protein [Bacillus chungangensis]
MKKDVNFIINHLDDLLCEESFIGIGSTRKVYRYKEFVIKKHLHELGYKQSLNEQKIYQTLEAQNLSKHIAPVLYMDQHMIIQPYYKPLDLINNDTYDLDFEKDDRITNDLKKALSLIDKELDGFDFFDSSNYGSNENGELVLIDYGMTKKLYENMWVPLAEEGILPQIFIEKCQSCGLEKELRIYGEHDTDRRCLACGKE